MDFLNEMYYRNVTQNEKSLGLWEDYLQNLKSLDFSVFSEKLKVPILVPIGSRISFRGELKHTNEVMACVGTDYFVKCSIKQADELRLHRIKGAQENVNDILKTMKYLESQMSFRKETITEEQGQEIIEYQTEEEDKAWRQKHRDNIKKYMQTKQKEKENEKPNDFTDEELWNRLEELELQEELENELNSMNDDSLSLSSITQDKRASFIFKEDDFVVNTADAKAKPIEMKDEVKAEKEMKNKKVTFHEGSAAEQPSKHDLLQQVIDRQNELDEKLHKLKYRERAQSKTEQDIMAKLEELEQLDELEDEMNRLDDIIDNEHGDDDDEDTEEEESSKTQATKLQRRVSFVDEDNSETLELNFKHSNVQPDNTPYDPSKGMQKPSDIYQAFANRSGNGTASILKKSKYETGNEIVSVPEMSIENPVIKSNEQKKVDIEPNNETQTIIIKDVIEKVSRDDIKAPTETKRMSLFKKKRMLNKTK